MFSLKLSTQVFILVMFLFIHWLGLEGSYLASSIEPPGLAGKKMPGGASMFDKLKRLKGRPRKGQLSMFIMALVSVVIAYVMIGVVLPIGATVTQDIGDTADAGTVAENVSNLTLDGLNTLGSWLPTIALVIAAVVIIGLVGFFTFVGGGGGGMPRL